MEQGFVYVARLIDYDNNFIGNFFKVGKTVQYKIRETQLNSTHLPFDIVLVRVFSTNQMSNLERILHTCLLDYRIEKKYTDRKSITTEWFDFEDQDDIYYRIDEIVKNTPNVQEIDVIGEIKKDKLTTDSEKKELSKVVERTKTTFQVSYLGTDLTQKFAKDTFTLALKKIADLVGWEIVEDNCWYVSKDIEKFRNDLPKTYTPKAIREIDDYKVWAWLSNGTKTKVLRKLITEFKLEGFEINYVE
jgi:hypothetical protein